MLGIVLTTFLAVSALAAQSRVVASSLIGGVWTTVDNPGERMEGRPPVSAPNWVQCVAGGPIVCGHAPIVIARTTDSYEFSKPEVSFDIDGDGELDIVGWPTQPDRLAFLAFDRNENGIIDNGTELFGDSPTGTFGNGFEALATLMEQFGPTDDPGYLVNTHPLFAKMLLWFDLNRNGISDPGELRPASDVLVAIGLGFVLADEDGNYGNVLRWRGYAHFVGDKHESINEREAKNGVTIVDVEGKPITVMGPRPSRDIFDIRLAQRTRQPRGDVGGAPPRR